MSQILSETTRLTGIFGFYEGRFQVPNRPGVAGAFQLNGATSFDSSLLSQRQRENAYYGTIALQYSNGDLDVQVAPFARLSRVRYYPDPVGDLIFNGVADRARLSSDVTGVQIDSRYRLSGAHTLRGGVFFQNEITHSAVSSLVFTTDPTGSGCVANAQNTDGSPNPGCQSSDVPTSLFAGGRKLGREYSIYLQDE